MSNQKELESWANLSGRSTHEISSYGRVRNKTNKRILKQGRIEGGYKRVCIGGGTYLIHRLVALAFLANPFNKKTVDHLNSKRDDNNVSNLRWATHVEQADNRVVIDKNNSRGVWQCDLRTNIQIAFFPTIKIAGIEMTGDEEAFKNISSAALGVSKSAYGFVWQYNQCEDLSNEQWKEFDKKGKYTYMISNFGRVRRDLQKASGAKDARLLKNTTDNNGYLTTKGSKAVHILVAKAFVENPQPEKFKIVNHMDGNKKNPAATNLEWTDHSGNAQHAADSGLRSNVKMVAYVDNNDKVIETFASCSAAARKLSVNTRSVNKCCKEELRHCGEGRLRFAYYDKVNNVILRKAVVNDPEPRARKSSKPRKVSTFDLNGKLLATHDTMAETSKQFGVSPRTISSHCQGLIKHPRGDHKFAYAK